MSQYILQSLTIKNSKVAKKALSPSGKSWVKAQQGTQYLVVDETTERAPRKQVLRKKGKDLVIEVDGEQVAVIRGFYNDVQDQQAPNYRIADTCNLDDTKSLEQSNNEAKYQIVVGGTGEGSAASDNATAQGPVKDGVVWHEDASQCVVKPIDPSEVVAASEGLTQTQLLLGGLGALLVGGAAVGISAGSSGGGGSSSSSTPPPATPQLTSVYDDVSGGTYNANLSNGGLTNDNRPKLTFSAAPGSTVKVYDGSTLLGTATEGPAGIYTLIPSASLTDGTHSFTATASNSGGTSAPTAPFTLNIDATAPAIQLTSVADDVPGIVGNLTSGALTNDNRPMLTFSAEPGSTLQVYDNGVLLGTAVEGPAGTFTLTPVSALVDGLHSFTATATDSYGNTSAPTAPFTLTIDTVGGGSLPGLNIPDAPHGVNATEASNGVELEITLPSDAAAGDVVTSVVTDPNGVEHTLTTVLTAAQITAGMIIQTVPLSDLKPGTTFLDGRWDVSTTVGDLAGNVSPAQTGSFNLAANAPTITLNTIAVDDIVNAVEKAGAVGITGTTNAEPGQPVTITVIKPDNTTLTYYAVARPDGTFSTSIPSNVMAGLADGTYTLAANVSNAAGTPAVAATKTVMLDATAPTVTITSVAGDAGVNGTFDGAERGFDNSTYTLSPTVTTPPVISGTTTAEAGQTVTVLLNGKSYSAVVQGNGSWSVTLSQADSVALVHGNNYPISVSVTDHAGNPSTPASGSLTANIAPADVPTVVPNFSGTTTPIITGTAKDTSNQPLVAGDTIVITINGVSVTATIQPSGTATDIAGVTYDTATNTWSIDTSVAASFGLTNGTFNVAVAVTHNSSTRSDISVGELVINTVPPSITLNSVSGGTINAAEHNQATSITGTTNAEPGSTVTLNGLGGQTYTAIVQAGVNGAPNTFSIPVSGTDIAAINDGTLTLSASVTNSFGLTGNDTENLIIDATAPSAPAVTLPESPNGVNAVEASNASAGLTATGTPLVLTLPADAKVGDIVTTVVTKPDGTTLILTHTILAAELPAAQGGSNTSGGPYTIAQNIPTADLNVDGSWTTSTTITDAAGNIGAPGTGTFTLDTQAPGQPAVALPEGPVVNAAEAASLGGTPIVTTLPVNAAVGDVVTTIVTKPDGTTLTLNSTLTAADIAAGTVSQTIPTSALSIDGAWTTSTTIADIAGNISPARAGGFTLDTTPPAAPAADVATASDTGVSNTDNNTSDTTPTISGTGTAGDTITVTMPTGEVLTTVVAADGTWSVTPTQALADGLQNVLVTATDPAGNTSPATTVPVRIDTAAPATPAAPDLVAASDTGSSSTDNLTADNTPTFSGTGTPGDTITVYAGTTALGTALVDANGNWTFTAPSAMVDGVYNITTTETDPAGNTSAASPALAVTIDTSAPAAPAAALDVGSNSGLTTDNITNDNTPTITGTGTDGDIITLYAADGTTVLGTATVSGGVWSITPTTQLADGLQSLSVKATDPAGNVSAATPVPVVIDTTPPSAPPATLAVASNSGLTTDNITNDNTPTITGTGATPGDTITLYAPNGTSVLGTAVVASDGTWSITTSTSLSDGTQALSVKTTDPAGNVSAATPVPVVIDTAVAAPVISPTNGAVVSGTGEPGATVTLTGPNGTIGTGVVAADGSWSITPSSPLANGAALSATQTDPAGNVSSPGTGAVTPAPLVNPTDGSPITGTGHPGDAITVTYSVGGTPVTLGPVTVAADGTWSVTPGAGQIPADGTTVTATDTTNNSTGTGPVDLTAPTAPTGALADASNSGLLSDNITNDNTPTITGSGATPGDTITLYAPNGTTVLGTAVVASNGTWSITPVSTLADGAQNLSIKATDPAGNTSAATAVPVVIDTSAPAAPVITSLTDNVNGGVQGGSALTSGGVTNDSTPTLNGTAEPNSTVSIYDGGVLLGTAAVDGSGNWTFTPSLALPSGLNSFTVKATDAAGNTGAASTAFPVTVDTSAPAAPAAVLDSGSNSGLTTDNITKDTTPTISGTGTPGDTITVTFPAVGSNPAEVLTVVVGSGGIWSLTPTGALADGLNNVLVTATDPAGNTSPATTVPVVIDTTAPNAPAADVAATSDTGSSNTDNITSDNIPTITGGSATPGDTITVTFPAVGSNPAEVLTVVVASDGSWSVTPTHALPDGVQSVTVTATDPQGNISAPTTVSVTIDTNVSAPTGGLDTTSDTGISSTDNLTKDNTPLISGAAEPDATISVVINGLTYTTTANSSGQWQIDLQTAIPVNGSTPASLPNGSYTPVITATDTAGNSVTANGTPFTVDITAPAAPVISYANGTAIVGTGEPGATVTVTDGSTTLTAVVAADGTWSITAITPFANTTPLTATQTDPAGNVSGQGTATVDTTVPAAPVILLANASTVSGTGEPGATIALTLADGTILRDANGAPLTVTVDSIGNWTATLGSALADSATVKATQTAIHNSQTFTANDTAIVDAMPPAAPAADIAAASDTGSSNTDNITRDTTPTIEGAGAEPGTTITLTAANGTPLGTAVVAADGTWSITPIVQLPAGTQNLSVAATDAAGNTSPATLVPITIDTSTAAGTGGLAAASDTGVTGDNRTNDNTPALSGTAEAGASVAVTVNGVTYTTTADSSGNWSIPATNTLANGTYTPVITVTDIAGNTSTGNGTPFTVDTTATAAPSVTLSEAPNSVNASEAASSGGTPIVTTLPAGAQAGDTVTTVVTKPDGTTLTLTTVLTAQDITNGNITQVVPTTDLTQDGSWTTSTTLTDAAGNASAPGAGSFTLDTTAPAAPGTLFVPENSNGGVNAAEVVSGGGVPVNVPLTTSGANAVQAGDVITLTVDDPTTNTPITITYTVTVADITNGSASILVPTANIPVDGTYVVRAVITDPAGNTSSASTGSFTVDMTAPNAGTGALSSTSDTLNGTAQDNITSDNTPILTGTAEAGSTVEVTINGVTYPATLSGTIWTLQIPAGGALPDGSYTPTIKVTDAAGNSTTSTGTAFTVDASAPVVAGDLATASDSSGTLATVVVGNHTDNITNDTTPAFTGGNCEAGNVITLVLANGTYKTTVQSDGTWTIDTGNVTSGAFVSGNANTYATFSSGSALDLALPNNGANVDNHKDFNVTVTATDTAGNSASVTIPVTIDTIVTDPTINITNGISPVTGTGEAGASVVLYQSASLASNNATTNTFTTVNAAGTGSVTVTYTLASALANGHELTTSKPHDVVISSQPAAGQTGTVTLTISRAAWDARATNPIALYDSVQTGQVVTVDANGNWSVTFSQPLANGTFLTVNSVDLAGNFDPPGVAIVQTDSSVPLINPTNGTQLNGTGKPGDYVKLTVNGQPILDSQGNPIVVLVDSNGHWAATPGTPLANATQVTVTDIGTNLQSPVAGGSSNATVDANPPAAPTIDLTAASDSGISSTDNLTNDTTPTLSGTGEAGSTIKIYNGSTLVGTATVAADGTWTATLGTSTPLTDGVYNLTATATDAAGNTSAPSSLLAVTIDTQGPSAASAPAPDMTAATDTGISNTDNNTANSKPAFTIGTLPSGAVSAVLYVDGVAVPATYDPATGTLTPTSPIADGAHTITYAFTDAAGNSGTASPSLPIVIDTTAPSTPAAPDLQAVSDTGSSSTDNTTADTTPTFDTGLINDPNVANVILLVNGAPVAATYDPSTGALTPNTPLLEGTYNIAIQVVDTAGNTSPASTALPVTIDTTAPAVPMAAPDMTAGTDSGTSSTDNLTNDSTPDFNIGALPAGVDTVKLLVDGVVVTATISTVVVNGVTQTVLTPNAALADGPHQISYQYVDLAGNISAASPTLTATIDTAAPAAPVITTVSDNVAGGVYNGNLTNNGATNDTTPTLTLTAAPGSIVKVYDGATPLGTATEDPAHPGTFTFTPSSRSAGTHTFTATATDPAGNTSGSSNAFATTVDATPPATPVVTAATSPTVHPTISGTATVATGEVLTVTVNGATYTINPSASSQPAGITYNSGTGAWSVDTGVAVPTSGTLATFAAGQTYSVTATTTDAAGNSSTDTSTAELTISSVTLTGQLDVTSNSGLTTDTITNDTTPTISGLGTPGQTIKLYASDGTTVLGSVVVPGTGVWSITPTTALANGLQNLSITSTSTTNVVTGPVAVPVTIDNVAPVVSVTSVFGDTVNDSTALNGTFDTIERGITLDSSVNGFTFNANVSPLPVISGTASGADGRTLTLSLSGHSYTTTVQTGGAWSVAIPSVDAVLLNHGTTYAITASVSDVAGNTGMDTNNGVVINIAPPDVPTVVSQVTLDTTPLITGVANKIVNSATVPLANGDILTVLIKDSAGTTTLQTYNLTIGGASSPAGLTYSNGTWSLQATILPLGSYNVDVSTTAGGLTRTDISSTELKIVQPVSITSIPEAASSSVLSSPEAADGTPVNVSLTNTGAIAGDVIRIMWDGQPVDVVLTAADIAAGSVAVTVPQSVLLAATPNNTNETLNVTAALIVGTTTISTSTASSVAVDFRAPTAPTISATTWAATGAANASALTGVGEANYAADATTFVTTGTVDSVLWNSEFVSNGTVVRVQLPFGTASSTLVPAAAGNTLILNWGQTQVASYTLLAADITAKYVDITVPASAIYTAGYGNVAVTAQIVNAVGNGSALATQIVPVAFDLPLALPANTTNPTYGYAINGAGPLASVVAINNNRDAAGGGVTNMGDLNGDGFDDFAISDSGNSNIYVVFGHSGNQATDLSSISAGQGGGYFIDVSSGLGYGPYWNVASSDMNGDGLNDLIVGLTMVGNDSRTDSAYVIYGKSTTTAIALSTIENGTTPALGFKIKDANIPGIGTSTYSSLGGRSATSGAGGTPNNIGIVSAGDVNGDGFEDYIFGEPTVLTTGWVATEPGRAFVLFGTSAGYTNTLLPIMSSNPTSMTNGFFINGNTTTGLSLGASVGGGGDVNGDGLDDLVISNMASSTKTASVFVVYGKTDGLTLNISSLTAAGSTNGFQIINAAQTTSSTGVTLTAPGNETNAQLIGDVNGDGLADISVSMYDRAVVVFGKSSGGTVDAAAIAAGTSTDGFVIQGDSGKTGIFGFVVNAGDMNGDGLDDMVVATTSNHAYLVFGQTAGGVSINLTTPDITKFVPIADEVNSVGQASISTIGDVNGDGFDDIMIGVTLADPAGGANFGKTYVVYGGFSDITSAVFQTSNGDVIGTSGNDAINGTAGNNQLIGGAGDDVITGNGGADVMYGGAGNDTFVLNADNVAKLERTSGNTAQGVARINGGNGIDTIKLDSANLDLTSIQNVPLDGIERFNLNGNSNTLTLGPVDVVHLSLDDNAFNTTNGWTASASGGATGWGAINRYAQAVVDGDSTNLVTLQHSWTNIGTVEHTENGTTTVYKVMQSNTTAAQVLIANNVQVKMPPGVVTTANELPSTLNYNEAVSGSGTPVQVSLVDTGAVAGNTVQLNWGGQTISYTLTAQDITNGYANVPVSTSILTAVTGAGTSANVPVSVTLLDGATTVSQSDPQAVAVNFVIPTAPTINATAWAATGAGNTSAMTGIQEALYDRNSATFNTAVGTTDNRLYYSEVSTPSGSTGTVMRVQLPTTGAVPPVAGDYVIVNWGNQTITSPALSATDITNKYIDITMPFSAIDVQAWGSVTVTAQVQSGVSGNISATTSLTPYYVFDLPLANTGNTTGTGDNFGFQILGRPDDNTGYQSGFGNTINMIGDVNGDGFDDMVVSAGQNDTNSTDKSVFVVFGQSGAQNINLSAVANGVGGFQVTGVTNSIVIVAGHGDYNNDGLDDFTISMGNGQNTGGALMNFVVFGKTNTADLALSSLNTTVSTNGFMLNIGGGGTAVTNYTGTNLNFLGDLNGDGYEDLGIYETVNGSNWNYQVVYGDASGVSPTTMARIAGGPTTNNAGYILGGTNALGYGRGAVGADINGDGYNDVIAELSGVTGSAGTIDVYFGGASGLSAMPTATTSGATGTGYRITGLNYFSAGSNIDHAFATADINGDGLIDIVASSNDTVKHTYVFFGKTDSTSFNATALSTGTSPYGFQINGIYGQIAAVGDFNGDGLGDLVVTDKVMDTLSQTDNGGAWLIYGKTTSTEIEISNLQVSEGFRIDGVNTTDYAGSSVSAGGDINGDGFADLIISSPVAITSGTQTQTVGNANSAGGIDYVVFGGPSKINSLVFQSGNGDIIGTSGNDLITDTTANRSNQFIGGLGDDVITGNGGADVMYGGAGNDTFVLNADNIATLSRNTGNAVQNIARIDGGTGIDTITFAAGTLDMSQIRNAAIENIERFNLTGTGALKLNLLEVLNSSELSNAFNTTNGWAATSSGGATGWGAVNKYSQVVVDGTATNDLYLADGWDNIGTVTNNSLTYKVLQSTTAQAQVLVDNRVVLHLAPQIVITGTELTNGLTVAEAASSGTDVKISLADTGAVAGNTLTLVWGGQTIVYTVTSTDVTNGYANINVPQSTLTAETAQGTAETVAATVTLTAGSYTTSSSASVRVDFTVPTAPTISATAWAATGAGNTSAMTGIQEAYYDRNSTTFSATAGTVDNVLYYSEASSPSGSTGTVIRVQLPTTGTVPTVAGDVVIVTWGGQSFTSAALTATDITNKYLDVTIPYSAISAQSFGTVTVTAQIQSGSSGNLSGIATLTPNYVFDLPLANTGGVVGDNFGWQINGRPGDNIGGKGASTPPGILMVGDVNGDGFDDMVIGAGQTTYSANGAAFVVFGSSAPQNVDLSTIAQGNSSLGFMIGGLSSVNAISLVIDHGDFNDDGLDDISFSSTSGSSFNSYIVYGKSNTATVQVSNLGTTANSDGLKVTAAYGGLNNLGDLNGDGIDDWGSSTPTIATWRSFQVTYGTANATSLTVNSTNKNFELTSADYLYNDFAQGADVNGDGYNDLILRATSSQNSNMPTQAEIYFGSASGLNASQKYVITGLGGFQGKMIGTGDINGDGKADMVMSTGGSVVYVNYGKSDTTTYNMSTLTTGTNSNGFVIQGSTSAIFDQAKVVGDFNGDGLDDIVIGQTGMSINGAVTGGGYLIYGKTSSSVVNLTNLQVSEGFRIDGALAGNNALTGISGGGDINGDGFDDLIVSSPTAINTTGGAGQTSAATAGGIDYIIFGGPSILNPLVFQSSNGDVIGTSGNDAITDTTANRNNQFIGGLGDDVITGNGGADVMYGGAGNDTFVLNADNIAKLARSTTLNTTQDIARIDGGNGTDTIKLDGSGLTFDLTAIRNLAINSVENLDITGSGANTVKLSLTEVLDLGQNNLFNVNTSAVDTRKQLMITGDAGDVVQLTDFANWTLQTGSNSTFTQNSHNYVVYNHNTANVQLLVDEAIYNASAHANIHA